MTEQSVNQVQASDAESPEATSPTEAPSDSDSQQSEIDSALVEANRIEIDVPAAGERKVHNIDPGMLVVLADPAFDPSVARYFIDVNNLLIIVENGGVVVLRDMFLHSGDDTTSLSVAGGPPVLSTSLVQQANAFDAEPADDDDIANAGDIVDDDDDDFADDDDIASIEPAAGDQDTGNIQSVEPAGGDERSGGNASFSPYDQGTIGDGLDQTGPLDPTSLGSVAAPALADSNPLNSTFGSAETSSPPSVSLRASSEGTIADISDPPPSPESTDPLPDLVDRQAVPDSAVNGVSQASLTGDGKREISLVFESESAGSDNVLGYYTIDADGNIGEPKIAFANLSENEPGDTVSLGVLPDGQRVNLFLIKNGAALNDSSVFDSGNLRFENSGGDDLNVSDRTTPRLVHVADDGTETQVNGDISFGADASESTPNDNRLNSDGKGRAISGLDPETGDTKIAFEDTSSDDDPESDRDFNDAVIRVRRGSLTNTETVVSLSDSGGLLNADIVDPDSTALNSATVRISDGARDGDTLRLNGFSDDNDDGLLDGTNIAFEQRSDTEISLSGEDSIENYTSVVNSIRFVNKTGAEVGDREIEVRVTDSDGNESERATSTLSINDNRIAGTDDADEIEGTDGVNAINGGKGDDQISGLGGNDVLDGGEGNDRLSGGDGDDLINGGQGSDRIRGGDGADTFRFNSLSEGRDTVLDFNANEGDRLDLTNLFEGTGFDPLVPSASNFLRFDEVDADGDGVVDDVEVLVDIDGDGDDHGFVPIFTLLNAVGIDSSSSITSVTTFSSSDGATS